MKKFKLFTTIASLCLAVALMAFGVYAASTQTFTVSANVKYDVGDDIAGTATVKSYQELADAVVTGTAVETKTTSFNGIATTTEGVTMEITLNTKSTAKYIAFEVSFAADANAANKNVTITLTNVAPAVDTGAFKYVSTTPGTQDTAAVIYYMYNGTGLVAENDTAVSFTVKIEKAA
ncbi:MAG: hypothetical protein E7376_01380 [Clostridiales bacterium]|nr:hypothetical protein [Clostridiales bacterium]